MVVIAATSAGSFLARNEGERRERLEAGFDARAATGARFVEAYVDELWGRGRTLGLTALTGDVAPGELSQLAAEGGYRGAGLFDEHGRLLAGAPDVPALIGTTGLPARYPHLARAFETGTPTISGVVRSTAYPGERMIGFAVPFSTGHGMRVLSVSYSVARTPMERYLQTALPARFQPSQTYLVDRAGELIAGGGQAIPRPATLRQTAAEVAGALGRAVHGFVDVDGRRTYYTSAEIAGTPWRLVFTVPAEVLFAPISGTSRWVPWGTLAAFGLACLVGIALLERYLAERTRLRTVLETAADAYIAMDAHGVITNWNDAARDTFGWSAEQARGRRVADLIVPEHHREAHVAGLARFTATGRRHMPPGPLQLPAMHRDGHEIPVELSLTAMPWQGSWQFHAFLRDISERRRSEAAVVEAERRFRVAFDMAPAGTALISLQDDDLGRLIRVNRELRDMFGYTVEELERRTLADAVHPDDRAATEELAHHLGSGLIAQETTELRCVHADGHTLWVELSARAIPDADGTARYAVTQIHDITGRRAENQRLTALAMQDPLTGLANRALLSDRLERALARSAQSHRLLAVMVCDLDQFKPVNDTYGHAAGDHVLREVAARLRECVRPSDTVARLGGDEFVVLCEDLDGEATAERIHERIHDRLHGPFILDSTPVGIGASIGLAITTGTAGADVSTAAAAVLAQADRHMYQAKHRIRDASTPAVRL